MVLKLSLAKKAFEFLQQNPEQEFTAREIANRIHKGYPDEFRQKPVEQLRNEISRLLKPLEKRYPEIKTIGSYPTKCYFTGSTDGVEIDQAESRLNLPNKVLKFLQQNPERKFTAREIADWIFKTYPDECRQKRERSTRIDSETALLQGLRGEINSHLQRLQKRYPAVKPTKDDPRRWYFTESTNSVETDQSESSEASPASKKKEHDLYPILSAFLQSKLKIYSKRIDEKQSKNSRGPRGNKHLYPDLVGIKDISSDWDPEIKQCVKEYGDEKKKSKLWSFEVKRTITGSTVREAYLQAVSNSSWANFGYLVASDIEGEHTRKELHMLAKSHDIGFILLNAEKPLESQILIQANERSEINWDTANRLIVNTDFREYIKLILNFHLTGELKPAEWDSKH